jgi:hypothetical protein
VRRGWTAAVRRVPLRERDQANRFGMGTYLATTANSWSSHMQGNMANEYGIKCMGIFAHQRLFGHYNEIRTCASPITTTCASRSIVYRIYYGGILFG